MKTFSDYFDFCHYFIPYATIKELLDHIENKLKDFTANDYCLIFMGGNDIKSEINYIKMINMTRDSLQKVVHTNKIICKLKFLKVAPIYNFKVDTFNNLLYLDVLVHNTRNDTTPTYLTVTES